MERLSIEGLLRQYVDTLDSARSLTEVGRSDYEAHFTVARNFLARWRGGESEEGLRAAIAVEFASYRANPPAGLQAETVGGAFGALCRAIGVI